MAKRFGPPCERKVDAVTQDLAVRYVTTEYARAFYSQAFAENGQPGILKHRSSRLAFRFALARVRKHVMRCSLNRRLLSCR